MATPLASILPQPETQFVDANGVPYAGGFVYTYVPNTLTPKNTWTDSQEVTLNTNPIVLDGAGRCIMYGSGQYRIILKDSLGNTVYDQLSQDFLGVLGTVAYENIGANLKDDGAGNLVSKITTSQNIVAASTTNLGSLTTDIITVTGNTTITSFGSSANVANPFYILTFSGTPLLTYNATSLKLPGQANIQAAAGDTALAQYLGSGNWNVLMYQKVNGQPVISKNLSVVERVFASTQTFTPTAGAIYTKVRVQGGGGGGGGGATSFGCGSGGSGGGYGESWLSASTIGASQSIIIGAAGTAGAAGNNNGGTGGTTSFGALISCVGGTGGNGGAAGGGGTISGPGGGATGATFEISGGTGFPGLGISGASVAIGGSGAGSLLGLGGGAGVANNGGGNATGYGAGGGAAAAQGTDLPGGAGTQGVVITEEFVLT